MGAWSSGMVTRGSEAALLADVRFQIPCLGAWSFQFLARTYSGSVHHPGTATPLNLAQFQKSISARRTIREAGVANGWRTHRGVPIMELRKVLSWSSAFLEEQCAFTTFLFSRQRRSEYVRTCRAPRVSYLG